jgi:cytochrome c551/c552
VPRKRSKPAVRVGEVFIWLLFAALLFPAGLVGWAVGHDTSSHPRTKTVTVTASGTTSTPATTTAATTTAAAPTTTAAAAAGAAGKAIFISAGCGACHTFKPAATSGKVGPDLDTAPEADAKKAGMPLAAFVKQSIVDPNAYISPGFPKGVMPGNFASSLGAAKIAALVSFITGK